jgi:uncharacterized protein
MRTDAGIFISYRRSDAAGWAGRLSDSLKTHLHGVNIFRDIEDIPPGVEFDSYITEAVGSCRVLIALIGPQWLTVVGADGRRKLEDPADFTRTEISAALKRNVRVIPALVGGATIPTADQLPEELKPLIRRQAYELTDGRWADDCRKLADVLKPLVKPENRIGRRLLAGSGLAICLLLGVALAWYFKMGGIKKAPGSQPSASLPANPLPGPIPLIASERQPEKPIVLPSEPRPKPGPRNERAAHTSGQNTARASQDYDEAEQALRDKNYEKAAQLFKEAAAAGDANAMNMVGVLYYHGHGVTQDNVQAHQWFEKAANAGNTNAMCNLGALYAEGKGVAQDFQHALWWYQKAATAGNASGMYNVGASYLNGTGVARDSQEASKWFQKAADAGDVRAMYTLGTLYSRGEGVPLDIQRTLQWFHKAADAGSANAMYALGLTYMQGRGVSRDYQEAWQWYLKAANAGHAGAMFQLGVFCENGYGVPKDHQKARDWYQKAANGGYEQAEARLQKLGK